MNNIWLDDCIKPVDMDGKCKWVKTADTCIEWLMRNDTDKLFLDHDLGTVETGYDVLLWLEKRLFETETADHIPNELYITSYNPSAREKMYAAALKIKQLCTALNKNIFIGFINNKHM